MLTEEASRDRMWAPFPALRQVLEAAPPSDRHYGPTSVSDNVFEHLRRLVDIAGRAEKRKGALLEAAQREPELGTRMAEDLWRLGGELDALRHAFDHEIDSVTALCDQVRRLQVG